MAFISMSDKSGRIELAIFSDIYEEKKEIIQKDQILVMDVEVNYDEPSASYKLNSKQILTMEQARASFSKFIQLKITPQQMQQDFILQLQKLLQNDIPGNCPITIEYAGQEAKAHLTLDKQWWVNPSDKLISALRNEFGREQVNIYY
jgi:DNA polymerase-3 subunit alpha